MQDCIGKIDTNSHPKRKFDTCTSGESKKSTTKVNGFSKKSKVTKQLEINTKSSVSTTASGSGQRGQGRGRGRGKQSRGC